MKGPQKKERANVLDPSRWGLALGVLFAMGPAAQLLGGDPAAPCWPSFPGWGAANQVAPLSLFNEEPGDDLDHGVDTRSSWGMAQAVALEAVLVVPRCAPWTTTTPLEQAPKNGPPH